MKPPYFYGKKSNNFYGKFHSFRLNRNWFQKVILLYDLHKPDSNIFLINFFEFINWVSWCFNKFLSFFNTMVFRFRFHNSYLEVNQMDSDTKKIKKIYIKTNYYFLKSNYFKTKLVQFNSIKNINVFTLKYNDLFQEL